MKRRRSDVLRWSSPAGGVPKARFPAHGSGARDAVVAPSRGCEVCGGGEVVDVGRGASEPPPEDVPPRARELGLHGSLAHVRSSCISSPKSLISSWDEFDPSITSLCNVWKASAPLRIALIMRARIAFLPADSLSGDWKKVRLPAHGSSPCVPVPAVGAGADGVSRVGVTASRWRLLHGSLAHSCNSLINSTKRRRSISLAVEFSPIMDSINPRNDSLPSRIE